MQTILKSMHKCRSYGPDNLMNVTLRCDLDLHPTYKKVSNDTTPPQGQQTVSNNFEIHA